MRVAYFVNEYPKVSHTFIRREILSLERQGVEVLRIALRAHLESLPDERDRAEFAKTRLMFGGSKLGTVAAGLRGLLTSPWRSLRTFAFVLRAGWRSRIGVLRHLIYFFEGAVLRTWLREMGVQHVHAHFGTNPASVVMFCRLLGGPSYSLTIHGSEEFDRPEDLMLRDKVRHATFVATVSSFTRGQVYRWADERDWPKVSVVRCALGLSYFDVFDRVAIPRPRFLCIGRISKEKGQTFLVRAARILQEQGHDFEVVLAGDGPLRGMVEREVRDSGLGDRVRITGWVDSAAIRTLLAGTHTLVVPSLAEGLPIVIMEAFAQKTPVIASSLAGIPELVRPGENGWLVPASDPVALAQAMSTALTTPPDVLAAMGAHGHARTRELHLADTEAKRLADLFAGVLRS